MYNSLLTPEMMRKELACCIAYRTGEEVPAIYKRLRVVVGLYRGAQQLTAWLDGQKASACYDQSDLLCPLDAFAECYLVPLAEEFSPVSPELGVFAQFAS